MYLDKDLLYLIPFYDLKHMRSGKKRDTKLIKVRNICAKEYKEIIRKFKKSFAIKT